MKCTNCGYETEQEIRFCPQCGADCTPAAPVVPEPVAHNAAAEKILPALKDTLFLVICILMAASCVLSIAADGLPLINILMTVFLWLAWNKARGDNADAQQLRNVSGTVYAQYVITYVSAALILVAGCIFALAIGFLAGDPSFWSEIIDEFAELGDVYVYAAELIASVSGGLLIAVFAVVSVLMILFNLFSMRNIHRFAKSVYRSLEQKTLALESVGAAKAWLIVFAVCSSIGTLGSLASGSLTVVLSGGCSTAIPILAVLLINKYFTEQN